MTDWVADTDLDVVDHLRVVPAQGDWPDPPHVYAFRDTEGRPLWRRAGHVREVCPGRVSSRVEPGRVRRRRTRELQSSATGIISRTLPCRGWATATALASTTDFSTFERARCDLLPGKQGRCHLPRQNRRGVRRPPPAWFCGSPFGRTGDVGREWSPDMIHLGRTPAATPGRAATWQSGRVGAEAAPPVQAEGAGWRFTTATAHTTRLRSSIGRILRGRPLLLDPRREPRPHHSTPR